MKKSFIRFSNLTAATGMAAKYASVLIVWSWEGWRS
jgi:hypothetical protein